MEVSDTKKVREFGDIEDRDGFEKVNLFETERFFADVYCFEPGETQEPHEHEDSDKVYHVLEGEGEFTVGDERMTLTEGETVLAGAEKKHGVEATERTRVLVFMAPHPAHADEGHGHDHSHGHDHEAGSFEFGFVTVSTSRDTSEDRSGEVAREVIEENGQSLTEYSVVSDDADEIRDTIEGLLNEVDVVVTSGGTGLTEDDLTVETVRPMLGKEIPGFGEEFRRRSIEEVGTPGMLSRATGGIIEDTPVFVLPGSPDAVETGLSLALAEVGHVLTLVRREK